MKKFYPILSVAAALLSPFYANAQSAEIEGVTYEVLSYEDHTCKATKIPADMTEATIPSKVNIEGSDYTVVEVSSLGNLLVVNLPATVTELPFFSGYNYLQQVNIAEGNPKYKSVAGVVYNTDMTELVRVPISWSQRPDGDGIGNGLTVIPSYCFMQCVNLTEIEIGENVVSIEGEDYSVAFNGCDSLRKVVCHAATPAVLTAQQFPSATLTDGELYVPHWAAATYRATEYWNDFKNIKETSAIGSIDTDATEAEVEGYYDINGIRHAQPVKGFNVVKHTDGTASKGYVK